MVISCVHFVRSRVEKLSSKMRVPLQIAPLNVLEVVTDATHAIFYSCLHYLVKIFKYTKSVFAPLPAFFFASTPSATKEMPTTQTKNKIWHRWKILDLGNILCALCYRYYAFGFWYFAVDKITIITQIKSHARFKTPPISGSLLSFCAKQYTQQRTPSDMLWNNLYVLLNEIYRMRVLYCTVIVWPHFSSTHF